MTRDRRRAAGNQRTLVTSSDRGWYQGWKDGLAGGQPEAEVDIRAWGGRSEMWRTGYRLGYRRGRRMLAIDQEDAGNICPPDDDRYEDGVTS